MSSATGSLLDEHTINQLSVYEALMVGFSGGLDSTVLLHSLMNVSSLRHKITVIHVNHGISAHALQWELHCRQFCIKLDNVPFTAKSITVDTNRNLEENARIARYGIFNSLIEDQDCLLLGHHQDDQAETLLLQLFRGAGVDGLAAMARVRPFGKGVLYRPFLNSSRVQLEEYARTHRLEWIHDESNNNLSLARNYVRHKVLPMIIKQWPAVSTNLSRTALHCQQAVKNLEQFALTELHDVDLERPVLNLDVFLHYDQDRIANVVRVWLKKNNIKSPSSFNLNRIVNELIIKPSSDLAEIQWSQITIKRYQNNLYIQPVIAFTNHKEISWDCFPQALTLQNASVQLIAYPSTCGLSMDKNAVITIRYREGGESFLWRKQTKKLKKLFQDWKIVPWERELIPLIYINGELAAVANIAISDAFYKTTGSCFRIELHQLNNE